MNCLDSHCNEPYILHFKENILPELVDSRSISVEAFRAIPAGVMTLDLRHNDLRFKTGDELAEVFRFIPAGVDVILGENSLFVYKSHKERDGFLSALSRANLRANLNLSNNGESDFQRALAPFVSFSRSQLGIRVSDVLITNILSYLCEMTKTNCHGAKCRMMVLNQLDFVIVPNYFMWLITRFRSFLIDDSRSDAGRSQ